jgi:hypothetical protein
MTGILSPAPLNDASRQLGALGGVLLDAVLVALLLFAFADRFAPPQDLMWKPLALNDPVGMATRAKVEILNNNPALCRQVLRTGGVHFAEIAPRSDGFCSTLDAIRIQGGTTALSPAGPVMTCREAVGFALWDRQVLQPLSERALGSRVATIDHYGTYACRRMYGRATGMVSEHARANALDFAGVRLADGRRITVARDFRAVGPPGQFLRGARNGACAVFRATLSPDYNAAHHDHLHLDMGRYRACR